MWWCWRLAVLAVWATVSSRAEDDRQRGPPSGGGTANSPAIINQLEKSLLSIFGLEKRPQVKKGAVVPPYMLHMYHQQTGQIPSTATSSTKALQHNLPVILHQSSSADTIRSFTHSESAADDQYPSHKMRYRFNVSTIRSEEILQSAELLLSHIHHSHVSKPNEGATLEEKRHQNNQWHRQEKWKTADGPFLQRIMVYDVMHRARATSDPIIRLLDTKLVDVHQPGIQSLDVSDALRRWIATPQTNYGLLVEVVPLLDTVTFDTSYVRLRRSADITDWPESQPLLVTYSNDSKQKRRSRRSVYKKYKKGRYPCHRHPLYVDFRKVGWDDWIVAPVGYEAYFCKGDCPFPLADHMNATNHAVVQTLVNSRYPDRVPKACCVPTELTAISMLYMDDDEKFVLKNHQDMVVEGCGCR